MMGDILPADNAVSAAVTSRSYSYMSALEQYMGGLFRAWRARGKTTAQAVKQEKRGRERKQWSGGVTGREEWGRGGEVRE